MWKNLNDAEKSSSFEWNEIEAKIDWNKLTLAAERQVADIFNTFEPVA